GRSCGDREDGVHVIASARVDHRSSSSSTRHITLRQGRTSRPGGTDAAAATLAGQQRSTVWRSWSVVVIGRPERGVLSRLLLGSISRHLLANAVCLMVGVRTVGGIDRVVAAISAPEADEQTVAFAVAEAKRHRVPVHVATASSAHGASLAETV